MHYWFRWILTLILFIDFTHSIKANHIIDSLEARLIETEISPDYILLLSQLSHYTSRVDIEKAFEYLRIADSIARNLDLEDKYLGAIFYTISIIKNKIFKLIRIKKTDPIAGESSWISFKEYAKSMLKKM